MKKAILVDGNSIMNRAFFGTQSSNMRNADGQFTGALFGFLNIMLKHLEETKPDYTVVAFDKKAPTFRHKMYEGYKATRHPMPEELASQMPIAKELLEYMGIDRVEMEGYEADDLLGTFSFQAQNEGIEAYILTGDRDSFQLISDDVTVKYFSSRGGKSETVNFDRERFKEEYGVEPIRLIDIKALMGDSSDNVPGVPGVGEKTALELIRTYGSLDGVYDNLDNITKKALHAHLEEGKESAYMSKTLVTIDRNVPTDDITTHPKREIDSEKLIGLLRKLEFKSFIQRFEKESGNAGYQTSSADPEREKRIETVKVRASDKNYDDLISEAVRRAEKENLIAISYKLDVDRMDCVRVSFDDKKVYVFDFTGDDGEKEEALDLFSFTSEEAERKSGDREARQAEREFVEKFRKVLENEKVKKVFYSAKPFVRWLKERGCDMKGLCCDVKIAAYLSDSLRRNDTVADAYRYYKGETVSDSEEYECAYMTQLPESINERLEKDGMLFLYNDVELPLVDVLADMEVEGFKVRPDVLKEEGEKYNKRLEEVEKEIYDLAGGKFNINSPKQLGEVLFENLKIAKGQKSKTGYKTGADVLEELADKHPIVPLILEYRQNKKLMSTYIDGLLQVIDPKTGKIHSTFNQTVTATGRLSSTEPNLQNIPVRHELGRRIRSAFVPSTDGRVLVDADYSQIELRIMAHLSGDKNMTETFIKGGDIHTMTAAKVNGIEPSEVTQEMRTKAKAVNFGIIYGISDFGLARDLGVGFYEAKRYIEDYFKMYPGVKEYLDSSVKFAKKNGYAVTVMGRRRYLPELRSSKYGERQFGERVAMNMPIQGTAADIIKFAMVRVHERLKQECPDAKLILQVHDELLLDVDARYEEKVKNILRECMENAMELSVPLPVSISSGTDWGIK